MERRVEKLAAEARRPHPFYLGLLPRALRSLSPTPASPRLLAGQVQSHESGSFELLLAYYS